MSNDGLIDLARSVDSITVGVRIRRELGEISALCDSIARIGLIQPITITPEGVLIAGFRRLTAIKQLGWRTVKVWVRSDISTELQMLLAEQDENMVRKDFSPIEQAHMFAELKRAYEDEAKEALRARPRDAHGHLAKNPDSGSLGGSSRRAARAVTGRNSDTALTQVLEIERLAEDPTIAPAVQEVAVAQLSALRKDTPVLGPYAAVKKAEALQAIADALAAEGLPTTFEDELLRRRQQLDAAKGNATIMAIAKAALKRANEVRSRKGQLSAVPSVGRQAPHDPNRWVPRALAQIVKDTDYWWLHLDPAEVGSTMKPDQWEQFEDWVHNAVEFRNAARPFRRG